MASNTNESSKAVVVRFLEVFSTGNVPGILEQLHDDATWWVSGRLKGLSGTYTKIQLAPLLLGATELYKTGALRIVPLSMIAEGDRVAVEAESYAELKNGKVYNNRYHFVFELAGDKIMRVREYMDTVHAYETFLAPSAQ
ncbi:hypothetical protein PTE30175_05599 [Pandoraea terrae]|uniref:SnoaL-like domain-containing protein n=1 Tax=Pandoraea terrae TaxID=1537710 RepID=A0A5E4ZHB1_9BURK|nr:nuclear transport factor 2 family protein [Pandoraea terrae]VVE59690.1 hypothetical protein PTE30175_05599 [Pandoraea terrae]